MKPGLVKGARHQHRFTVTDAQLVPALFGGGAFADMPAVLATGQMVALLEWGCVEQMRPYYEDGEDSLGIHIDVDHAAPTLPGQTVTVSSEVEEIDGRFIWFRVSAHDGIDQICAGRHRRAVIDTSRFAARLDDKRSKLRDRGDG
ncbi:MAG: thioesterase family protein [Paracoccus sp. (in: a-proteobacteria)]|nr:thioesterase family protein [Paracoccus sp. (in: a-proteobacteria)]